MQAARSHSDPGILWDKPLSTRDSIGLMCDKMEAISDRLSTQQSVGQEATELLSLSIKVLGNPGDLDAKSKQFISSVQKLSAAILALDTYKNSLSSPMDLESTREMRTLIHNVESAAQEVTLRSSSIKV